MNAEKEKPALQGSDIRFTKIRNEEQLARLETFARSFGHEISDYRHSYFAMHKGEHWFGYFQEVTTPLIYPAFHPEGASHRDVVEVMKMMVGRAKLTGAQDGFVAAPVNSPSFTPDVMRRLGFQRQTYEIYKVV